MPPANLPYTSMDTKLCEAVELSFQEPLFGSNKVEFQFPPKMTSDSRKGSWSEGDLRGVEPVAEYETSGPREMSLSWTYIVDGGKWTTTRIAQNIRRVRGYFAQVRASGDSRNLICRFKMWSVGGLPLQENGSPGLKIMTCFLKSVDVKHGETIIVPDSTFTPAFLNTSVKTQDVSQAFYLRTDVTIDLRQWSMGSKDQDPIVKKKDLVPVAPPEWY